MAKENTSNSGNIKLHVLGCRGSMSVSGPSFVKYGGATSSYLYMTDTEAIIIDAGTGILNLPDLGERHVSLLISHSHIDHILGLPMFLGALGAKELTIYGAVHEGLTIRQQLDTYLKHPLWPVGFDVFACKATFVDVKENAEPFLICHGDRDQGVMVTAAPSNHPGGSTIYKLECQGTSIVYASDFEHEELPKERRDAESIDAAVASAHSSETKELIAQMGNAPLRAISSFAKDADIVLYDAQYTAEEYQKCKAFGHSTPDKANELRLLAGVKHMLLVHHAPGHTDTFLDGMEREFGDKFSCSPDEMRMAKEGDVILIK